jgi:hypothetical protein
VDPVVLFKPLFIGYLYGIRSEHLLVKPALVPVWQKKTRLHERSRVPADSAADFQASAF